MTYQEKLQRVQDEVNRISPKTQSALLEVMEERQASVEGETRKLRGEKKTGFIRFF